MVAGVSVNRMRCGAAGKWRGWGLALLAAALCALGASTGRVQAGRDDPPGEAPAEAALSAPLLPDLRTLPPWDLTVEYAGRRRLLRLANMVWNGGAGPLELTGRLSPSTQQTIVTQHLARADGTAPEEHVVGEFVYHPTHGHFHLEDFARYEVWSLTPAGGLYQLVASGGKISYCLIETDIIDREHPSFTRARAHTECGQDEQGILPGWGDRYKAELDGQTVDVTRLSPGRYALLSTANPDGALLESDYGNNTGAVVIELGKSRVTVVAAPDLSLNKPADNQCTATTRPALRRC
jgi:hypothetical protein